MIEPRPVEHQDERWLALATTLLGKPVPVLLTLRGRPFENLAYLGLGARFDPWYLAQLLDSEEARGKAKREEGAEVQSHDFELTHGWKPCDGGYTRSPLASIPSFDGS